MIQGVPKKMVIRKGLSFWPWEVFLGVKKILRTLGKKKILGCLMLDFDALKKHHVGTGQDEWTALTLESLCDWKCKNHLKSQNIWYLYVHMQKYWLLWHFEKVFHSWHGQKLIKTPKFLHFYDKQCPFTQKFAKQPIFFLFPKFLELFFTHKNTPPKLRN